MRTIHYFTFTCIAILFFSCRKWVSIEPAPNLVRTAEVFESDATAKAATDGVYLQLLSSIQGLTAAGFTTFSGLYCDELIRTNPNSQSEAFFNLDLQPSTGQLLTFYTGAYRVIYQTNAILEGLGKSVGLSRKIKSQFIGEMLSIRSWLYLSLTNVFDAVPYVTSTDFRNNEQMPRTNKDTIYKDLKRCLREAIDSFNSSPRTLERTRGTVYMAYAMLARIAQYEKDYNDAAYYSSQIIESGNFTLSQPDQLSSVFRINNPESIFEIAPGNNSVVGDALNFVPSGTSSIPPFQVSGTLVSIFNTGDKRFENWIGKRIVSGNTYYYPFKYKQRTLAGGQAPVEYQVVFRVPEFYLIRAEANAELGILQNGLIDLNKIRTRAGLPAFQALPAHELKNEINLERRRELFCEYGHRWLDIKRSDHTDSIMVQIKGSRWLPHKKLWPLPEKELLQNPSLVQNPGY